MSDQLREVAATWAPPIVERTEVLTRRPLDALARLLGAPDEPDANAVPALWHWLHFDHATTGPVDEDGHPLSGPHLPPLPHRRRMVAGGRLHLLEPLPVGASCTRRSEVAAVELREGRSGGMLLVTVRHDLAVDGRVVAHEEEDIVYRVQPPGSVRALARPRSATCTPEPGARVPTDEVTLFRFSALTGNAHRIHYDHPYATGVEGYPGLVVHGPLLVLGMLEAGRRRGDAPTRLSYRFLSPGFCRDEIGVGTDPDTGRLCAVRPPGELLAWLDVGPR